MDQGVFFGIYGGLFLIVGLILFMGRRVIPFFIEAGIGYPVKLFNSNLDVVDDAFEYLMSKSSKGEKGQYFTPRYVIDMCVKMLNPKADETMIDPASGFRVIIMTVANSQVNTRVLELLPKFKIKKMNGWCAV